MAVLALLQLYASSHQIIPTRPFLHRLFAGGISKDHIATDNLFRRAVGLLVHNKVVTGLKRKTRKRQTPKTKDAPAVLPTASVAGAAAAPPHPEAQETAGTIAAVADAATAAPPPPKKARHRKAVDTTATPAAAPPHLEAHETASTTASVAGAAKKARGRKRAPPTAAVAGAAAAPPHPEAQETADEAGTATAARDVAACRSSAPAPEPRKSKTTKPTTSAGAHGRETVETHQAGDTEEAKQTARGSLPPAPYMDRAHKATIAKDGRGCMSTDV